MEPIQLAATPTSAYTAAVLDGGSRQRLARAERVMRLMPALAEGTLVSARLALQPRRAYVAAELQLDAQPRTARIQQRIAFWIAREGGWSRALARMEPQESLHFREMLDGCDLSMRDVLPEHWAESVRRLFAVAGAATPFEVPLEPVLTLHVDGPGWHGYAFEPGARLLQVPSPLAPPAGDELCVSLEPAGAAGERCCARATVISVTRPAEARPGAPAGFTLALDAEASDAVRLLSARCPRPGPRRGARLAPRYPVLGRVHLTAPGEDLRYGSEDEFLHDYVENLSHGGAFVRTAQRRAIGDHLVLKLHVPGREPLAIPAMVVHCASHGVGLQFELAGSVEAALSAAVAGLAGRPRRVLVVDDDALARELLTDAFAARGFDTVAAIDGDSGLRGILDELLALDAVVTDVHMPGLSGEALVSAVRKVGGEAELVLVAVTADSSAAVAAALVAAGANTVVPKNAGPGAVVAAVEEALGRRRVHERRPGPEAHAPVSLRADVA